MWRDWSRRFVWLSLGSMIGRLLPYTMLIWLGRELDSPAFAAVGVAFAWAAVAASLTTGGLGNVAAQRLAVIESPNEVCAMVRRIALIGVALSVLLVVSVLIVGNDRVVGLFGYSVDARVVWPSLLSGATWSLVMLAVAVFNGLSAARQAASVLSIGGALQALGLAMGLWIGQGQLNDILWGLACGNVSALVFTLWRLSLLLHLRYGSKQAIRVGPAIRLGSAVAWATLATASVTPVTFAAGAIISHAPNGALQLARFHALEQLHQLAIYFPNVMAVAMLPVLSRQAATQDSVSLRNFIKAVWFMAFVGTAVALALTWDPSWLHRLVGNPALNDNAATRGMLVHAALSPSLGILGTAILARGKFALATLFNIAWAAVFLGATWICREEGTAAVQTARLIASSLLLVVMSTLLLTFARSLQANSLKSPRHGST